MKTLRVLSRCSYPTEELVRAGDASPHSIAKRCCARSRACTS
jgi:hypothetical protein